MQLPLELHPFVSFDYTTEFVVLHSVCTILFFFALHLSLSLFPLLLLLSMLSHNLIATCVRHVCVCVCAYKHVETNTVIAVTYKHTYDHNHWEWERQKRVVLTVDTFSSSSSSSSTNWCVVVCFSTEARSNHIDALECDDSPSFSIDTHAHISTTTTKSSSSIACTLCTLTHRQLTHFSWFLSLKHNCLMFISRNRIEWNLFVLSLLFEFLLKICGFHTFQTVHPSHVFFSITSSFLCYGCYHSGNKPHNQFIIALHIEWMCTFG